MSCSCKGYTVGGIGLIIECMKKWNVDLILARVIIFEMNWKLIYTKHDDVRSYSILWYDNIHLFDTNDATHNITRGYKNITVNKLKKITVFKTNIFL